jgi:hypothetical protein
LQHPLFPFRRRQRAIEAPLGQCGVGQIEAARFCKSTKFQVRSFCSCTVPG